MIFEKVQAMLSEHLNLDLSDITKDSNIIDDLGADSLDIVEMIMQLEEEFDITVSDDKLQDLKTVGDLVTLIEKSK